MPGSNDGHDDDLESLKRTREARGHLPEDASFMQRLQHRALRGLAAIAAMLVFCLVWYRVYSLCGAECGRDGAIALYLGLATLAALLCCSLYFVMATRVVTTANALALHVSVAGLAWLYWIVPMGEGKMVAELKEVARSVQMADADTVVAVARSRWVDMLQSEGRSGPPGTFPADVVSIDDAGDSATVTNRTDQRLVVALARVREVAGGGSGSVDHSPGARWTGCGMYSERGDLRYYWRALEPGAQMTFKLREPCAEAFRGAPIELRIGQSPADHAPWWSESAFEKPGGREHDGVRAEVPKMAPKMGSDTI